MQMNTTHDDHALEQAPEQTSAEETNTSQAKVTEIVLAVKTMALATETLPITSIDEEIAQWKALLDEWNQHMRQVEPSRQLDEAYQVALHGIGSAYFRRYEERKQVADLSKAVEL
jgi:hypothetical protein